MATSVSFERLLAPMVLTPVTVVFAPTALGYSVALRQPSLETSLVRAERRQPRSSTKAV